MRNGISGGEDGECRGEESKAIRSADPLPTATVSEVGGVAAPSGSAPRQQQHHHQQHQQRYQGHQRQAMPEKTTSSKSAASASASVSAVVVVDKRSREYVLKSGLAGGLAGCAAKTVVGPLDRVKILFQASNPHFAKYTGSWFGAVRAMSDIYTAEGARGLFRGHSATLLRIFPYAAVKFLTYEQIRAVVIPTRDKETALRRFMSGSLAGCASVCLTYPLEVVRVRLAWETKRGASRGGGIKLLEICQRIYNEVPLAKASGNAGSGGTYTTSTPSVIPSQVLRLTHFFRGFVPTLVGMLPYAGASFLAHDTAGDLLRQPAIAKYTTISRQSVARIDNNADNTDRQMDKKASTSIHATNDQTPLRLRSWAQLTAGGFAGFISQTVSYPLEVIRRRMQVGGVVGDGHRLRMAEVAGNIWREKGVRGFFVGLGIGYVKVVPMVATSFFVYGRAKDWLGI